MSSITSQWYRLWQKRLAASSLTSLRGKRLLCAFNAVIDRMVAYNKRYFATMFRHFEPNASVVERKAAGQILFVDSPQALCAALIQCFGKGKAAHLPLSPALAEWLGENFHSSRQIGGQAGIVAEQVTLLGGQGILYSPMLSPQLAGLFSPRVKVPIARNNSIDFLPVRAAANQKEKPLVNWIFEFQQGQEINFGGKTYSSPRSNRLILYSQPSQPPAFDEKLTHLLPELGQKVDAALLSGYHALQPRYEDGTTFEYYLAQEELYLRLLKSHKHIPVQVEFVSTPNKAMQKAVYEQVAKHVDSLGLNEVEMVELTDRLGYAGLARDIVRREGVVSLHNAGEKVMEKLDLQRLHLHSLVGYSLIMLNKSPRVTLPYLRRQVNAALFGSLAATTRAMKGSEVTRGELSAGLQVPISEVALQQMALFSHHLSLTKSRLEYSLASGIFNLDNHYALIVPGQVAPLASRAVGLGDTLSSCAFLAGT